MSGMRDRRLLRQLQAIGLILSVFVFLVFGHTSTALLWVVALVVACVPHWNQLKIVVPLWIAMLGSVLLPVDISFQNRPGPPHFARYVMGLPGREAVAASKRGEVVLGGCVATGFEPIWVWVW